MSRRQPSPLDVLEAKVRQLAAALAAFAPPGPPGAAPGEEPGGQEPAPPARPGKGLAPPPSDR